MSFGRRPSSNQRRATPYVPAIAPNSLSEGLHEPARRRAFPPRFCRFFRKISSHSPKAESLAEQSTGQRPVFHNAKRDMPVRLSESRLPALRPRIKMKLSPLKPPREKITVPLDKGERARALRGKGVFAAVSFPHFFLSHPSLPVLLNRILLPKKIRSYPSRPFNPCEFPKKSFSKNLCVLCFFASLNPAGTQSPSPDLRTASFPKKNLPFPKSPSRPPRSLREPPSKK